MFCDLEGSTALTEKLGDEKAFALIDEIFGILTQQVHKYEKTVQKFRGDGIMALFGAPIAPEKRRPAGRERGPGHLAGSNQVQPPGPG